MLSMVNALATDVATVVLPWLDRGIAALTSGSVIASCLASTVSRKLHTLRFSRYSFSLVTLPPLRMLLQVLH